MNIRFFVILLSCALFGLLVLQFHWLRMAFDTQKERFRQQVHSGLSEVARKLDEREVTYDASLFAQNSEDNTIPQELCINEDSLIKPKKILDNLENNKGNFALTNFHQAQNNLELERLNMEAQTKKAEMQLLRAEQLKKELMNQKIALNAMLFLQKTKHYATTKFFPLERVAYGTSVYHSPENLNNNGKDYKNNGSQKPNFVVASPINRNAYENYHYDSYTQPQTENNFFVNGKNLNEEETLKALEKLGDLNNLKDLGNIQFQFDKDFGKDFGKNFGENFGENFKLDMRNFEMSMEDFGKKMEKLNFDIVNIENVIKTRKGDLVITLGNSPNKAQREAQRSQRKQKDMQQKAITVSNKDIKNAFKNNQNNRRQNQQYTYSNNPYQTNRGKDTIKRSKTKGEGIGMVVKGNIHQNNIKNTVGLEEENCDCEEENGFYEQHNAPNPVPVELPKEVSHFSVAQPNIILTNKKHTPNIEKDKFIEQVLENLEENKKNPNQMLEARQKLEDRLHFELLDSLIKAEMRTKGIDIPYNFVVERRSTNDIQRLRNPKNALNAQLASNPIKGDSLHKIFFEKNPKTTEKIIKAGFTTPIFVFRNTGNRYFLHLDFSQQHSLLLRNMIEMLLSSLALIALVIYCFVKAIRTILKQKKMSEMTTDFINNMTHELKTPIATVALACEALQDKDMMDKLPHQRSRYINMIQEENQRLQTQVEKVLHIAKLDKGEIALQYEEVDLNEILPDITSQMALQVESRGGKIDLELNATKNMVYSDKNHLSHIILNLLDNANKYSPDKPNILVKTQDTETGVKISVTDCGQGMTKDQQCKVFDKFYRVSTGNIHNVKGFGLGLSYVKTMTEALGGKVSVKSELGKGSTFEVMINVK